MHDAFQNFLFVAKPVGAGILFGSSVLGLGYLLKLIVRSLRRISLPDLFDDLKYIALLLGFGFAIGGTLIGLLHLLDLAIGYWNAL